MPSVHDGQDIKPGPSHVLLDFKQPLVQPDSGEADSHHLSHRRLWSPLLEGPHDVGVGQQPNQAVPFADVPTLGAHRSRADWEIGLEAPEGQVSGVADRIVRGKR